MLEKKVSKAEKRQDHHQGIDAAVQVPQVNEKSLDQSFHGASANSGSVLLTPKPQVATRLVDR